jgi:hypothetical protein
LLVFIFFLFLPLTLFLSRPQPYTTRHPRPLATTSVSRHWILRRSPTARHSKPPPPPEPSLSSAAARCPELPPRRRQGRAPDLARAPVATARPLGTMVGARRAPAGSQLIYAAARSEVACASAVAELSHAATSPGLVRLLFFLSTHGSSSSSRA